MSPMSPIRQFGVQTSKLFRQCIVDTIQHFDKNLQLRLIVTAANSVPYYLFTMQTHRIWLHEFYLGTFKAEWFGCLQPTNSLFHKLFKRQILHFNRNILPHVAHLLLQMKSSIAMLKLSILIGEKS